MALAVVGLLPIMIVAGIGLWFLFEERTANAQSQALGITRALATALDAELERSLSSLRTLATSSTLDNADIAAFDSAARHALAAQPNWQIISLADPTGRQVVNTVFAPGEALPPNQLEPESFERVVKTRQPAIGHLVNGRKGYAFPVRIPVLRDGVLRYVLTAVVSPEVVLGMLQRQGVVDDSVISVFDSRLTRVARSRSHSKFVATKGSQSLQRLISAGPAEGTGTTEVLEGGRVFTAYSRLPAWGWTVTMGQPIAAAYRGAVQTVAMVALAILVSLATGLYAAFTLARRVSRSMSMLSDAAHAVGTGQSPTPVETHIREVQQVAASLADAAAQLGAAEAERARLLQREQAARNQAEAANHAKDRFLAMLAHELRNPLSALSNAAHFLEQAGDGDGRDARARSVITRQVAHLSRLTDDLLDAARVATNKIELQRQPIDLAAVVANCLQTLAATKRTARHVVKAELHEAWVWGDPVRLDQITSNLLVNAVKYTPEGKCVAVRVSCDGAVARLEVSDEGEGLSADLVPRVFDLFVQGKHHIDRSQGGLGIGLTLVKALAELHGGGVAVESEGEGKGSSFTVSLPAIAKPAAQAAAPSLAAAGSTILVIEDNDDARETLQMLLQSLGHDVVVAADGAQGISLALAKAPTLALIDLGLPGMDGYQVAARLRDIFGNRTILCALSGYGDLDAKRRSTEAGFAMHFVKPLDLDALAEVLQRARDTQALTAP